jgi:2-polyprenyl-3-methyl-5-hydroxy-6-metoxy-1,4-benzoquinol methylase
MILKRILKHLVFFLADVFTDVIAGLARLSYFVFGKKEKVPSASADCFDSIRVREKANFELILDRPSRQIKSAYIQPRRCPSCDADSYRSFFLTQDLFDYVKCDDCGFIYALQMLTHETRLKLYGGLTGKGAAEICCSPAGRAADIQRFNFPLERILRHCKGGRLLDVGCGVGNFLNQAREAGFSVEGIETHEEFRQAAKEKYKIKVSTGIFEELDLATNHYQVVTMWETLEHIYDPKSAVRAAFRALSDEGILAISVPNLQNLGFLVLREYSAHRGGEHINFFSPATLARMVTDCGFRVLESHTTENSDWPAVINFLNLDLGSLYCYANVGKTEETSPAGYFFSDPESFFLTKVVFPLVSRYERRTGRGGGITLLAQKLTQSDTVS